MSTFRRIKHVLLRAVRSSVTMTSALFVADGILAKIKGSSSNEDEHLGGVNIEEDYRYSLRAADSYTGSAGVHGRVAEVGPGGTAAVALHLLSRGAQSVDLLDRFSFRHDPERLDALYRMFENYSDLAKVRFHVGEGAAAEQFFQQNREYDGIFSNAVFEHLVDPIKALGSMIAALKPGGRLVHQIDLTDHGMFSSGGQHELTFLTIPDRLYRIISESRGRPNRILVDDYRALLSRSDVDYRIIATSLVGVGALKNPQEVKDIAASLLECARLSVSGFRNKLARRFRPKAIDDLIVSSIRIEATKVHPPCRAAT